MFSLLWTLTSFLLLFLGADLTFYCRYRSEDAHERRCLVIKVRYEDEGIALFLDVYELYVETKLVARSYVVYSVLMFLHRSYALRSALILFRL